MSLTDIAKLLGKPYFQAPNCLIYLEIGFKTPSSVAGFNFLNPFLKIRELLIFVVY
jgi:hypothetical protein